MNKLFNITFSWAVLISLVAIAALTALEVVTQAVSSLSSEISYAIAIFAFGLIPIGLFYLSLRARIKRGVDSPSDAEVDSMYYLGFLITLITLITTVIATAFSTLQHRQNEAQIGDQPVLVAVSVAFALSLAATACALFCRIKLASLKEKQVADLSIDGLEKRVASMILQVDLLYSELTAVIAKAITDLERIPQLQNLQFAAELKTIRAIIEQELREFLKKFTDEVSSSGLIESLTTVTSSFRAGGGEIAAIIKSLGPIPRRISSIASSLDEAGVETSALRDHLGNVNASVRATNDVLSGLPIDALKDTASRLTVNLAALVDAIQRSEGVLSVGATTSSAALVDTTRQLEDASSILGRAFTTLSSELATAAEFLVREIREQPN